jgi:hypothetical protein
MIGTEACGDDLLCLQTKSTEPGKCTPFCDPTHPCPEGRPCEIAKLTLPNGPTIQFNVCVPKEGGSGGAGGMGGAGGAGGAGGSGGAAGGAGGMGNAGGSGGAGGN